MWWRTHAVHAAVTFTHLNHIFVMHIFCFSYKNKINNNVQKRRIRKAVMERATYVYASLAHVAASAASDKMKARLTCVCVNSCPLHICGKRSWYLEIAVCLKLSLLISNQTRWCSTREGDAMFTEMGSCVYSSWLVEKDAVLWHWRWENKRFFLNFKCQ